MIADFQVIAEYISFFWYNWKDWIENYFWLLLIRYAEGQLMENQAFIWLALIQQNQAPQTLDKYICKLAELILLTNESQNIWFGTNLIANQQ